MDQVAPWSRQQHVLEAFQELLSGPFVFCTLPIDLCTARVWTDPKCIHLFEHTWRRNTNVTFACNH